MTLSFYYLAFPGNMATCDAELGCCSSDVTFTANSQTFQNAAYACTNASGADCVSSTRRPIAGALSTAHDTFSQTNGFPAGPRFVLLITGGEPQSYADCFMPSDCQSAINEMDALKSVNATTYIIGMGDQTNIDCLLAMANDEGLSNFYSAAPMSNDLARALETVSGDIALAACHMTLLTPVVGSSQLRVSYNQAPVAADSNNGWTLDNSGSRLVLHGSACANFLESPFDLQVNATCVP